VLNTITRNYGENLPVICIVGRPNSNDYGPKHVLHHTIPPPPGRSPGRTRGGLLAIRDGAEPDANGSIVLGGSSAVSNGTVMGTGGGDHEARVLAGALGTGGRGTGDSLGAGDRGSGYGSTDSGAPASVGAGVASKGAASTHTSSATIGSIAALSAPVAAA
jgi:hypothetical protein